MIFKNNIRLRETIDCYGWSDGGIGYDGNDPFSGIGTGTGPGSPGTTTTGGQQAADRGVRSATLKAALKSILSIMTQSPLGLVSAQTGFTKSVDTLKSELSEAYGETIASNMVDHALSMAKGSVDTGESPGGAAERILDQIAPTNDWKIMTQEQAKATNYTSAIDSNGRNHSDPGFNYNETTYKGGADPIPHLNSLGDKNGKHVSDPGFDLASAIGDHKYIRTGSKGHIVPSQYVTIPGMSPKQPPYTHATDVSVFENAENKAENNTETGGTMPSFDAMIEKYNTTAVEDAIKAISDVDTDIQYNHTLADLSGIGLDDQEKEYYETQKQSAINRAFSEIENTFEPEGDSIIAQQIYNLGENALGGTIGREFINRWQERYDKAQTDALNQIESTYLAAQQSAIDRNKQNQISLWDKEYESDVKNAELNLDKTRSSAMIRYDWDTRNLDRYVTMRGQDISAAQAELDRELKDRLGGQEYDAWKSSNSWGAVGSIAGQVAGSDWFGDVVSGWF